MNNAATTAIKVTYTKGSYSGRYNVLLNCEVVGWVTRSRNNKWDSYRSDEFARPEGERVDFGAETRESAADAIIETLSGVLHSGVSRGQLTEWMVAKGSW